MGLFDSPNEGLPDVADKYNDDFRANQITKIAEENKANIPAEYQFDYEGAAKEGYTPDEIVQHLKGVDTEFNIDGAISEGYTPDEIVQHLSEGASKSKANQEHLDARAKTKGASDFELGLRLTGTGISKTGNDILHLLGIRDDKEYADRFKEIDEWTQTYKKAINDNDLLSMSTLGTIAPSLLTLPAAVETKLALFMTEGFLGYTEARATNDKLASAGMGVLAGGGSVAAMAGLTAVMNKISGRGQKNVFDYYRNQMNYTTEEAEAIHLDWTKTMESSGNEWNDKLRALIDYSGDKGAAIKTEIGKLSPSAQKAVDEGRANRIRFMRDLLDEDIDLVDFAQNMKKQVDTVKDNYSRVKWEINSNYKPKGEIEDGLPRIELPEVLEEIVTDRSAIKELLGREANPTAIDFIDAMPHINSILSKVKGVHKAKWSKVKQALDDNIKEVLGKNNKDYIKWQTANYDYAEMTTIKASKLGEAVERALGKVGKKSQITRSRVLELIKNDNESGDFTFESFKHVIGGSETAKLEKMIIQDALGEHADDISWEALSETISSKGFVTEEGKQLSGIVDQISKSFRTDDAMKQLAVRLQSGGDTGGIGSNIAEKFKISLAGRLFRMILKMGPTEGSKALRMGDKLAKILKSPTHIKQVEKAINDLTPGVKQNMIELAIDDTVKLIEYKPKAEIKAKVARDNSVLPTTKATNGMNRKAFQNAMTQWVREYGIKGVQGNHIIESAFKMFDNSKLGIRLQGVANSLHADKAVQNAKKVQAVIRNEAEQMAKAISKDTGLKVGPDMMEDLVNYVIEKSMKGCK